MCFQPSQHAARTQQMWEAQQAAAAKAQENAEAEKQRQLLLQQEADRKANIQTGNTNIDNAFGGFDDAYYKKAQDTYTGAYVPQIDYQHDRSLDQLKAALAGRGILESSVGAQAISDLGAAAAGQRAQAASAGMDFANGLKSKVADAKTNLYAQSQATADPNAIASAATGQASALAEQGQLTPPASMGDLFGSFLSPFINAANASQNSAGSGNRGVSSYLARTGAGSSYQAR